VRLVSAAEPTGTQRPAAPIRFRAATSNRQIIPHHLYLIARCPLSLHLCCLLPVVTDSWDPALSISDCAAPMDRPLYLLLHDEQVLAADPADTLYYSIANGCVCRTIAEAKALSVQGKALLHKGAVFEGVPEAALDRFLQLVTAAVLSGELVLQRFVQRDHYVMLAHSVFIALCCHDHACCAIYVRM
jgi:hypothetical protein